MTMKATSDQSGHRRTIIVAVFPVSGFGGSGLRVRVSVRVRMRVSVRVRMRVRVRVRVTVELGLPGLKRFCQLAHRSAYVISMTPASIWKMECQLAIKSFTSAPPASPIHRHPSQRPLSPSYFAHSSTLFATAKPVPLSLFLSGNLYLC